MKTFRRQFVTAAIAAVFSMLTAGHAWADCQNKATLTSTGVIPGATGTIEVKAVDTQQRLQVVAELDVSDGTRFIVITRTGAGPKILGTITIELGRGELKLSNTRGNPDPNAADPFCSIHTIAVVDGNLQPVLTGTF